MADPLDWAWYRRTVLATMQTVKLRSVREIQTRAFLIPAGTEFTIVNKLDGLWVRTVKCECCGLQAQANKVAPDAFEPIRPEQGELL